MKKIFLLLLILAITLSASACNKSAENTDNTSETTVATPSSAPTENDTTSDFILRFEGVDGITGIQPVTISSELRNLCKSYKFFYNSDGVKVQGYLSLPLNCTEDNPYKCILYSRGGNHRIGLLGDSDTARICAVTNRIVIASQYRGADTSEGKDEFGGKDISDVLTLIELCDKTFSFADMTDFCAAGVSRGGMMTYMTAKADPRIKRIITVSAVSDLIASYNNRSDMQPLLEEAIGGTPEELPEEYEKRSAICWTEKIKVPTLIIHSTDDEQVAYSQAEAIYTKLKTQGTDVTFITHNDNVHGFHNEDLTTISQWLNNSE